ncbi:type II toxin-antitoxin system prevent-host-death family antitoxin [Roseicella sp. DB1501]|uniref:type II toxin-antitoxin system prevent-host-death family antitoxin n=1 Tax=Roseicella sp. DB1501 TaxID=2730925 RepID=UPI00149263C2|nr:type II toxin-antitoxin system Phd/YefM family antitoxin [Roseicella sp. DB1501]
MRVTTAEFVRNWGRIADRALVEPVTVTRNGRDRLVVISAEEYARLKRRDRRVVRAEELSEAEIEMIARAEPPAETAQLDELLDGEA